MIWQLPLAVTETIIYSVILYFLVGFTLEAGRFFFFLLIMFMTNVAVGAIFRWCAYATHNQDVANQMSAPIVGVMFLCAGFLILYNNFPRWLIWLYWISPFSWIVRSLAINEFDAGRYDEPFGPGAVRQPAQGRRVHEGVGHRPHHLVQVDGGGLPVRLLAADDGALRLVAGRAALPADCRHAPRFKDEDTEETLGKDEQRQAQRIEAEGGSGSGGAGSLDVKLEQAVAAAQKFASSFKMQTAATALPFMPVTLAWRNIHYSVTVEKDKQKVGAQAAGRHQRLRQGRPAHGADGRLRRRQDHPDGRHRRPQDRRPHRGRDPGQRLPQGHRHLQQDVRLRRAARTITSQLKRCGRRWRSPLASGCRGG